MVRGAEPSGFVASRKVAAASSSFHWNVRVALLPEARGQGFGSEAQRPLVRYLFAHTTVVRIEADTEAENVAEQRASENRVHPGGHPAQHRVPRRTVAGRRAVCRRQRYSVLREDA
ncbi:GNAT family N-acetyltransferase [Streptomyces sp. NPDC002573]|uniref:GNAT family N-acetyltransferase n=1 Tax=Streptomyces sp. NPDC002573 TaxID=3364651 RepID=UPI003678D175